MHSKFPSYIGSPETATRMENFFENRGNWKSVEKYMGNDWLTKTRTFEQTYQKIEWQVKTGEREFGNI